MPAFCLGWCFSCACHPIQSQSGLWIGIPRSPGMTQLHIQSMRLTQIQCPARQAHPSSQSCCQGGTYSHRADRAGDSMTPTSTLEHQVPMGSSPIPCARQKTRPSPTTCFPAAVQSGKTCPGGVVSWPRGASMRQVRPHKGQLDSGNVISCWGPAGLTCCQCWWCWWVSQCEAAAGM